MKSVLILLTLGLFSMIGKSQERKASSRDSSFQQELPLVSHKCNENRLPIHYSYDSTSQIHNYSGNWDFDKDGKKDAVFFIGTGGAHLYFYLRVVLSLDNKKRDFSFLEIDHPCAGDARELIHDDFGLLPMFPQFVVHDFDSDSFDEIYLHIDQPTFSVMPMRYKRKVSYSRHILLKYKNGNFVLRKFQSL